MKTKSILHIVATVALCAVAPLMRAQCPQACNDGFLDTALGTGALVSHTGGANTAVGFDALYGNTTGGANTTTGKAALNSIASGYDNTAIGWDSLVYNTIGYFNPAPGAGAFIAQSGNSNTASRWGALNYNYTGNRNTATGPGALMSIQPAATTRSWERMPAAQTGVTPGGI